MSYNISGIYDGDSEDLYNYYKGAMTSFATDSDSVTDSGDSGIMYNLQFSNDTYVVSLFITDSDGEVAIIMSVTEK